MNPGCAHGASWLRINRRQLGTAEESQKSNLYSCQTLEDINTEPFDRTGERLIFQ
jgi:hypothetical protein